MTNETPMNRPRGFVISLLPWILAAAMLVVYLSVLSPRVSVANLAQIAELTDLNWQPNVMFGPVTFLITYPLRWLPMTVLPLAANLISVVCAVLSLALLARSVALLPQDRTQEQRDREPSEFSLLSLRSAWLPPVLAVLACGLSLTFWEHAVAATGEMINLLLFAYLIRCLLEYRVDQREAWLEKFALVCGIAVANSSGIVALLPCFLIAVIWIKGMSFFNVRFIIISIGCWLVGFSLILLLPLVGSLSHTRHLAFWDGLHSIAAWYKWYLTRVPCPDFGPEHSLALLVRRYQSPGHFPGQLHVPRRPCGAAPGLRLDGP